MDVFVPPIMADREAADESASQEPAHLDLRRGSCVLERVADELACCHDAAGLARYDVDP